LSFVLVFLGVFGGVIAFGFVGIFPRPDVARSRYGLTRRYWAQVETSGSAGRVAHEAIVRS
jgi:hypothetical protein